jgi:hypothetical protein
MLDKTLDVGAFLEMNSYVCVPQLLISGPQNVNNKSELTAHSSTLSTPRHTCEFVAEI